MYIFPFNTYCSLPKGSWNLTTKKKKSGTYKNNNKPIKTKHLVSEQFLTVHLFIFFSQLILHHHALRVLVSGIWLLGVVPVGLNRPLLGRLSPKAYKPCLTQCLSSSLHYARSFFRNTPQDLFGLYSIHGHLNYGIQDLGHLCVLI